MKKSMVVLVAVIVAVMVSGCALFQSIDKPTLAFMAGEAGTLAYYQAKPALTQDQQDAVDKVWQAFNDNAGQVTPENIKTLPDMMKKQLESLPEPMKSACYTLIDTYWMKLNEKVNLSGSTGEEISAIVIGLQHGIQAGIDMQAKNLTQKGIKSKVLSKK